MKVKSGLLISWLGILNLLKFNLVLLYLFFTNYYLIPDFVFYLGRLSLYFFLIFIGVLLVWLIWLV